MAKASSLVMAVVALCALAAQAPNAVAVGQSANPGAQHMALLLEKSGYSYKKVDDGIWEIAFKGKNIGEFTVRVALGADLVLVMAKMAERKEVSQQPALFVKLLELNDKLDSIKFSLSSDMLYVRTETHHRVVDVDELKYMLEQVSAAVDEAYPQIKQYLGGRK